MSRALKLSDILPGQRAVIMGMELTGGIRRRLLDIGLIDNTEVECLGRSPFGDPSAYLIRGAVIAIREDEGRRIRVRALGEG